MNELDILKREIEELKNWKKTLENSATIPLVIDQSFRKRFETFSDIITSTKSATSENQGVNEGGVASYSVMNKPDGFLQITISGVVYYLPYFS